MSQSLVGCVSAKDKAARLRLIADVSSVANHPFAREIFLLIFMATVMDIAAARQMERLEEQGAIIQANEEKIEALKLSRKSTPDRLSLRKRVDSFLYRLLMRLPAKRRQGPALFCVRFMRLFMPDFWVVDYKTEHEPDAWDCSGKFTVVCETKAEAEKRALEKMPDYIVGGGYSGKDTRSVLYNVRRPNLLERLFG